MLASRSDPRREGDITAAFLLRGKVRLAVALWVIGAAAILVAQLSAGLFDGPGATFAYAMIALCLSMAIIRYRRAYLLPEGVPDVELRRDGLLDNQSGAGLIAWDEIEEVILDRRRSRGAANALILLRLRDPDRYADRLHLGRRIAGIGMWPRTGNCHYIDASELDCTPEALTESIRRRMPGDEEP